MLILLATLAFAKVKTGVPPRVTSSPVSTPLSAAVPVAVAVSVPSYVLSSPVRPVTVSSLAVMSALSVGWVKV